MCLFLHIFISLCAFLYVKSLHKKNKDLKWLLNLIYITTFGGRHYKLNSFAFHRNGMGSILFWCVSANLTLTLNLPNSEFVAQTEALKYHLLQIITPNGKKTSHLSLISRAKQAFISYHTVNFYCTNKCR